MVLERLETPIDIPYLRTKLRDVYVHQTSQALLEKAIGKFDVPDESIDILLSAFEEGQMPPGVVDVLIAQEQSIKGLAPDKYPFKTADYDFLSTVLDIAAHQGVDIENIWQTMEQRLKELKRPDLISFYGFERDATLNLVGVIAHYGLTFHDIPELNRTVKTFGVG